MCISWRVNNIVILGNANNDGVREVEFGLFDFRGDEEHIGLGYGNIQTIQDTMQDTPFFGKELFDIVQHIFWPNRQILQYSVIV